MYKLCSFLRMIIFFHSRISDKTQVTEVKSQKKAFNPKYLAHQIQQVDC